MRRDLVGLGLLFWVLGFFVFSLFGVLRPSSFSFFSCPNVSENYCVFRGGDGFVLLVDPGVDVLVSGGLGLGNKWFFGLFLGSSLFGFGLGLIVFGVREWLGV